MALRVLKRFLPEGLYGRSALILIIPILVMQIVVTVVFIQRHYDGVSERMTRNYSVGIGNLHEEIEAAAQLSEARAVLARLARPLSVRAELPASTPPPAQGRDRRELVDLTGRMVTATLRAELDAVRGIDLVTGRHEARLWLDTRHGPLMLVLERQRLSPTNPHQLLVIVLLTGILMTLIAFVFLRNQIRPIRQLAQAAEAFGKGRSVDYRPRGAAEVRAAGRAFLEMRDRLERQIESRTRMLSAVSHDLRTPLTRLRLGLALREESDPDRAAMLADVVEMERLVESFLSYVRGEATDDPVRGDPLEVVRAAVEDAQRAGHEVTLVLDEAGHAQAREVEMRPQLLRRALDNLVANAVCYGTRAELEVTASPGAICIRVEDDGPGIDEERRAEALQPFVRLDPARSRNAGEGVGLGLAIVADSVRAQGGTLNLGESARLGGLRAEICLPH